MAAGLFSDVEVTKTFQILGLPEDGVGSTVTELTWRGAANIGNQYQPVVTDSIMANVKAKLLAKLTGINATGHARCQRLFVAFDDYNLDYSTANVQKSTTSEAPAGEHIFSARLTKDEIRMELINIIGFWVSEGGFAAYAQQLFGNASAYGPLSGMGGSGAGDR